MTLNISERFKKRLDICSSESSFKVIISAESDEGYQQLRDHLDHGGVAYSTHEFIRSASATLTKNQINSISERLYVTRIEEDVEAEVV